MPSAFSILPFLPVLGWWIWDLQFQWRHLDEYQFGWIVLLLTGYLVWEQWPTRPTAEKPSSTALCLSLALLGTPFVLLAELYKQAMIHAPSASFALSIGCILFLVSLILYRHGARTLRHFAFPLCFFCLAVPIPGLIWNPVVLGLKEFVTRANVELLNLFGMPALREGNVIRLPNCTVGIDEACSGVRSLQSSVMAGLFLGAIMLHRRSYKILLVFAAVSLALLGNLIRSFTLSVTAYRSGSEALAKLHDAAGWSILIFSFVGLGVITMLISKSERRIQNAE